MAVFTTLFIKLIPLYSIITLGYIAGKYLKVSKEAIAPLLIYIIAPAVIFYGTSQAELSVGMISLPILLFSIACLLALTFYSLGKKLALEHGTAEILGFSAGTGNTGYFGLPVVTLLLGNDKLSIVVLATLGILLYENTLGYFLVARNHYTVAQSLQKLKKLPTIYAFFAGLLINILHIPLAPALLSTLEQFKGSYTILGMMIIGLGLGQITKVAWDSKFISLSFLAKFICWPLIILSVIFIDKTWLQIYSPTIHQVLMILAVVPLAANTVVFATELRAQPEKAAIAVLISTLLAIVIIPLTALFIS